MYAHLKSCVYKLRIDALRCKWSEFTDLSTLVFLRPFKVEHANRVNKRKFIPPALNTKSTMMCGLLSPEITLGLARKMIQIFQLNPDQASALIQIAQMMASPENDAQMEKQAFPITIIHGKKQIKS